MGVFRFKQFEIDDSACSMKVGTDSVLLGAWTDIPDAASVIDAGAGSGLLSLMTAQRCRDAVITAVEIDTGAYQASVINFNNSPWGARINAICTDISTLATEHKYDLMITNPPYFTSELRSPDITRATARHATGNLSPITAITLATRLLKDTGTLAMVTPYDYNDAVTYHAEMSRLKLWRKCTVYTNASRPPSRILWQMTKGPGKKLQQTEIKIRDNASGNYTPEYIKLTQEFYLNI